MCPPSVAPPLGSRGRPNARQACGTATPSSSCSHRGVRGLSLPCRIRLRGPLSRAPDGRAGLWTHCSPSRGVVEVRSSVACARLWEGLPFPGGRLRRWPSACLSIPCSASGEYAVRGPRLLQTRPCITPESWSASLSVRRRLGFHESRCILPSCYRDSRFAVDLFHTRPIVLQPGHPKVWSRQRWRRLGTFPSYRISAASGLNSLVGCPPSGRRALLPEVIWTALRTFESSALCPRAVLSFLYSPIYGAFRAPVHSRSCSSRGQGVPAVAYSLRKPKNGNILESPFCHNSTQARSLQLFIHLLRMCFPRLG